MRVAITARGPSADSDVDERLGRAYWLLIHDMSLGTWESLDNSENRNALHGAGFQTAQALVDLGVTHLLTGETGPKAFRILHAAGIIVFHGAAGTVQEVLDAWREGRLRQAGAANESGSPYCLMGEQVQLLNRLKGTGTGIRR